jgi:hypothetical protein
MTANADTSPPTHARVVGSLDAGMVAAAVYFPVRGLLPWRENYRRNHKVVELARTILRTTWGAVILAQASTRRQSKRDDS